jgi:hypothetical protein
MALPVYELTAHSQSRRGREIPLFFNSLDDLGHPFIIFAMTSCQHDSPNELYDCYKHKNYR